MDKTYIDANKLKELISKKWKGLADKNVKVGGGKYDVEISTYLSVLRLIDSLLQEQSEADTEEEDDGTCPVCGCALDAKGYCSYCGYGRS